MKQSRKEKTQELSVRSINLLLDSAEPAPRLDHFHLTRKGAAVLHRILAAATPGRRSDRVMTVAAPPGSGKSFLALFTGSLLLRSQDAALKRSIEQVLARASTRARFVKPATESYLKSRARILPVYLVGETPFGLHSAILNSIEEALALHADARTGANALRDLYATLRKKKLRTVQRDTEK